MQKTTFTELDRLATVVHEIERECQIVPEGAFKLMPSWELRHAQSYYGLKIEESTKPEKYLHFRKPSEQHFQKFISTFFNPSEGQLSGPLRLPRKHQRRPARRLLVHSAQLLKNNRISLLNRSL